MAENQVSHNDTVSAKEPARCRRPVSASAELYIVTYMNQKVKDPKKMATWRDGAAARKA